MTSPNLEQFSICLDLFPTQMPNLKSDRTENLSLLPRNEFWALLHMLRRFKAKRHICFQFQQFFDDSWNFMALNSVLNLKKNILVKIAKDTH